MARKQFAAAAVLLMVCFAAGASARALKQGAAAPVVDDRTTSAGGGAGGAGGEGGEGGAGGAGGAGAGVPDSVKFTLSVNPKLNLNNGLDVTAAAVTPKEKLSVTPLALALQGTAASSGSYSPSYESSSTAAYTAPSTSSTTEGGNNAVTVNAAAGPPNGQFAALLQAILAQAQSMKAQRQAMLGGIGSGALLNKLG